MKIFSRNVTLGIVVVLSLGLAMGLSQSNAFGQQSPIYYFQGPTGGAGGKFFTDIDVNHEKEPPAEFHIESVEVGVNESNTSIIGLLVQDGRNSSAPSSWSSEWHGSSMGSGPISNYSKFFDLMPGERLVGISGTYGKYINNIVFQARSESTGEARFSESYGSPKGNAPYSYTAPPGCEIVAFWGRSGRTIDAMGPIIKCGN